MVLLSDSRSGDQESTATSFSYFNWFGLLSNRGRKKTVSRMSRFEELRGELGTAIIVHGANDGKSQRTIFAVFKVRKEILD
jgi:hypothetical protein